MQKRAEAAPGWHFEVALHEHQAGRLVASYRCGCGHCCEWQDATHESVTRRIVYVSQHIKHKKARSKGGLVYHYDSELKKQVIFNFFRLVTDVNQTMRRLAYQSGLVVRARNFEKTDS